jgi:PH/SEC7 domain-containing protein
LPKQPRKNVDLRNHHPVHNYNNCQRHNSVPTSPTETERQKEKPNSAGASPTPNITAPSSSYIVRTSKSEDHLQFNKDSLSAVSIDIDDDVTSSLNTLLDTRPDSELEDQRIVWTYNAPLTDSSNSHTSSDNASPHRSLSPASPTSVSSSVMSSNSSDSDKRPHEPRLNPIPASADLSQSEAVSNISSPDFQEEDSEIITRDLVMEVSDPSDSDSTLLVSETNKVRCNTHNGIKDIQGEHRIVIQVIFVQIASHCTIEQ